MKRYPLRSLADALGCDLDALKRRAGLDHRQMARYTTDGLTADRADVLAVRLGLVAANVWPELIDDVLATDRAAYNRRKARAEKLRYHRDPRRRQQALENARRYSQVCGDYKNARKRARRQWLKENDPERLRAMDRASYERRKVREQERRAKNKDATRKNGRENLRPKQDAGRSTGSVPVSPQVERDGVAA